MAKTSTPAVRQVHVFTTHVIRASLKVALEGKSRRVNNVKEGSPRWNVRIIRSLDTNSNLYGRNSNLVDAVFFNALLLKFEYPAR